MTAKTDELKDCPFCGHRTIFTAPDEIGSGGQWVAPVHVGCDKCKAEQVGDDEDTARANWNCRAALQEQLMPPEISRDLLGGIVDQVFGGAIEDTSVIEDIYRVIACEFALQSQGREDAARLDWLDGMNARLNQHYGTQYQWELVMSPNIVRLMSGAGGNGHVAAIDLNDSAANGVRSCREAIDYARRRIEGEGA